MLKTKSRPAVQLTEHTSTSGRVDATAGVIRGVRIIGKVSKNGREYSDNALREAVPMYQGVKCYLDHNDPIRPNATRSVRDWVGVLENCRMDGDCVRGDLRLIKAHPFSPMILEAAANNSNRFGLSHSASGHVVRRGDKMIVESMEAVTSVDLVDRPATNTGLFESVSHPARMTVGQAKREIEMLTKRLNQTARRNIYEMDSLDHPATTDGAAAAPSAEDTLAQISDIVASTSMSSDDMVTQIRDLLSAASPPALAESLSDLGRVVHRHGQTTAVGVRPRPVPQQPTADETRRQAQFLKDIGMKPKR